jgi:hypothetical protein
LNIIRAGATIFVGCPDSKNLSDLFGLGGETMTNEYELSKKKWLEAIKRWQAEWRELVAETGIVPEIRGTHGIMLVSGHGINGPADLRFRRRAKV